MCVQFMIQRSLKEIGVLFGARVTEEFEFRPHVFPRYFAPVIGMNSGERVIKPYAFGLIPHFEKNEKPKMVFHNARVETLQEKPSFKGPFQTSRCLIPLESFLEYIWETESKKWVARFHPKEGGILAAAGLFQVWVSPSGERVPTFTMITREASPFILEIGHDRSPFFLKPEFYDSWMTPGRRSPEDLNAVLKNGALEVDLAVERLA
jgi:putative SOS response-associated peptidase YedK